jgi:DUF1680 family protein
MRNEIAPLNALFFFASCVALLASPFTTLAEEPLSAPVSPVLQSFPLSQVRLLEGPFKHAMELNAEWLLALEPDRLLAGFRTSAGLPSPAQKYGGWEGRLTGHTLGHYLSACAQQYAATGDERFHQRIQTVVAALAECQRANGDGYVGAVPNGKKIFAEIKAGNIRSGGFDLNGGWVPWYNLHKLFAGLLDVCRHGPDDVARPAREVVVGLADWALELTRGLSDEQMQRMLVCEHGGMNESLADVYALTREPRHLALAERFCHRGFLDPLAAGEDHLAGEHANANIPKVLGAARLYELTGEPRYRRMAEFFWSTVVRDHTYVIGGNSEWEHFGPPAQLAERLSKGTAENCNTYNLLKLTAQLDRLAPEVAKMDYYERALYNQILASQNAADGMVCYFSPLGENTRRAFSSRFNDFWCCVGSGLENHTKYGAEIYHHDDKGLVVDLFIASRLSWPKRGLELAQETSFPDADTTKLRFKLARPAAFPLRLRRPAWATGAVELSLNGRPLVVSSTPGSYLTIEREWRDGDELVYKLPLALRSEPIAGRPDRRAFLYGPIVLSARAVDSKAPLSVLVAEDFDATTLLRPVPDKPLTFRSNASPSGELEFRPYFRTGKDSLLVYFDLFHPADWAKQSAGFLAARDLQANREARTIDVIRLGEMQPERDHAFEGKNSKPGETEGRKHREARDGGEFSFKLGVDPEKPVTLAVTYWGNLPSGHTFDLVVDERTIASITIQWMGKSFFERAYSLPPELTKGKSTVTVTFRAAPGKNAGPVFEARTLR